jgi:hypothetical protein
MSEKIHSIKPEEDPVQLLKEAYSCIGSAISMELEYENYKEIERLKILRRKIEKLIL